MNDFYVGFAKDFDSNQNKILERWTMWIHHD